MNGRFSVWVTEAGAKRSASAILTMALAVLAVAFAGLACCPEAEAGDAVTVATWGELKDACADGGIGSIKLSGDIVDDSGDDAIPIGKTVDINLDGHKIDRQRGADGKPLGGIFVITGGYLMIHGGTLAGGHAAKGGCIQVQDGKLEAANVVFQDSFADDVGGAVSSEGGATISITGSSFANNASKNDGGALHCVSQGLTDFDSVKFTGNKSLGGKGGALFITENEFSLINCEFSGNSAATGGAFAFESTMQYLGLLVQSNKFTENSAAGDGGAMHIKTPMFFLEGIECTGNTAGGDGGALSFVDTTIIFQDQYEPKGDNVFKDNKADHSGGAISLKGYGYMQGQLEGAAYEGNRAGEHGGAIYVDAGSQVYVVDSKFTGNSAGADGGAILIGDGSSLFGLMGTVVVKDGTAGGKGPNICIRGNQVIECRDLADGCDIGIELDNQGRAFTTAFDENNPGKDPARIFKSDSKDYYVASDPETKEAKTFKSGSGGDMSGDNTLLIVGGVIAVLAIVGIAVYAVKFRKP